MANANSLISICQSIAERLSAWEQPAYATSTVAVINTISFPWLTTLSTVTANSRYLGDSLRPIDGDVAGQERMVVSYAPSTGSFGVSPNFSAIPANTTYFDIYKRGIKYTDIKSAVNSALGKLRYHTIAPLTLVADGDMEASVTTNWTAVNTTFTKVATAGNLMRGTLSGRTVGSAANGYIQSGTIKCIGGDSYYIGVRCKAAIGTAKLVAYDVTNSAEITSSTWAGTEWENLYFTATTPATCEGLAVRLQGVATSDDCNWDDVIALRTSVNEMALPTWVTDYRQIISIGQGRAMTRYDEEDVSGFSIIKYVPDESNPLNPWKVWLEPGISGPVWITARRPYPTLATDAATTFCDKETIVLGGCIELLENLKNRPPGQETQQWNKIYENLKKQLRQRVMNQYRPVMTHRME